MRIRQSHKAGFSVVELLILLVAVGGVLSAGYLVYQHGQRKNTASVTASNDAQSTSASTTTPPGTTLRLDADASQDAQSESSIDAKHSTSDQTNAQSANTAASNLGGAYDESSL